MKNKIFVVIILLLLVSVHSIKSQDSEDTTHIIIYEDGSAFWELETRFELKNEADRTFFEDYIGALEEEKDVMIEEKKMEIEDIINKLNLTTKRSMKIENLDLTYGIVETINKNYGVVKLQFLWHGFAERNGDKLLIGDVFLGGYYLNKNETMVIDFPQNYIYEYVYPLPDETRTSSLIWYGPKSFGEKEPTLILSRFEIKSTETKSSAEEQEGGKERDYLFIILIFVIGILFIVLFIVKIRKGKIEEDIFFDEDIIVDLLKKKGGKCLQNYIVEETGFSKSKISQVLNDMERKGVIRKKKIGRHNLIILNKF
ncbi:MAG: hypothetical protein KAV48_07140 [Methanomicrobia archaeon]|nr:hypothetical protein [Methanomicrobia archaeon]